MSLLTPRLQDVETADAHRGGRAPSPARARSRVLLLALALAPALLAPGVSAGAQTGPQVDDDFVCVEPLRAMRILIDPLANDSHPDGRGLVVTVDSQPSHGQAEARPDGSVVLHLAEDPPVDEITFTYTVSDGAVSASGVITVGKCEAIPFPPVVCTSDPLTAVVGDPTEVSPLSNDTPEGLVLVDWTQGALGTVVAGPGNTLIYTATETGQDQFEYWAELPGSGQVGQGTVNVTVTAGGGIAIPMGEFGSVTIDGQRVDPANPNHNKVQLQRTYDAPVVIAMPSTRQLPVPSVARVWEVGSDYFKVHLDSAGGDVPAPETVDYVVVESGQWTLPGTGGQVVANVTETTRLLGAVAPPANWAGELVPLPGVTDPVAFAQVQTAANTAGAASQWLHTRVRAVSPTGFRFILERRTGATHQVDEYEGVGWLAMSGGTGFWGEAELVADVERCALWEQANPYTWSCTLHFGGSFDGTPAVVAGLSSWEHPPAGPWDMHLRRNPVPASNAAVAAISEANNGDPEEARLDPHDVSFLALYAGGGGGILTGVPENRPPRVPALDSADVNPSGLTYVPPVVDPDAGDTYTVVDLEAVDPLPPGGWVLTRTAGDTRILFAGGEPFGDPFRFRYRVSDGAMRSRWATVEVRYRTGVVVTAIDDHYGSIPALLFVEGEQEIDPHGEPVFLIPETLLLANDFSTPPAEHGIGIHFLASSSSCGSVFQLLPPGTPDIIGFWNHRNGGQGCLDQDVTFSYYLCELGQHGGCLDQTSSEDYDIGTVTMRVREPNAPPVAGDDLARTQRGVTVDVPVLANDSDPEGSPLTVTVIAPPAHGVAQVLPGGTVRYTPAAGFLGTDGFDYRIADSHPVDPPATATAHVTVTVERDLVWESFHNGGPGRAPGSPLHGVLAQEGGAAWRATRIVFGDDAVTTDGVGGGGHASLTLPPLGPPGPASGTFVVEALGVVTSAPGGWIGAGLMPRPPAGGGNPRLAVAGTLWVRLDAGGTWSLRRDGLEVVAQGTAPLYRAGSPSSLRLDYEPSSGRAQVWADGVLVAAAPVGTLPPASLEGVAFELAHPAGTPSGATRLDHFVHYRRQGLTPLSPTAGDDFEPQGLPDRLPGAVLDRVWLTEGAGRWSAEGITFSSGGAVTLASTSHDHTRGGAVFPIVLANHPEAAGRFFEASFTLGDAERLALGFQSTPLPVLLDGRGELWFEIEDDGTWRLSKRSGVLQGGSIEPFDPAALHDIRFESTSGELWLIFDRQVLASGTIFVPLEPDVRSAGFDVQLPPASTGTFRIHSFRGGVLETPICPTCGAGDK